METLESKQSTHKVPYRIKWKKNAGPLIASTSSRLLSLCGGNARPWWSDLKADGDRGAAQVKADEVGGGYGEVEVKEKVKAMEEEKVEVEEEEIEVEKEAEA